MEHALLGASSSDRWIQCNPSARLTEHMKEQTSIYTEEGTLAHELCEIKLSVWLDRIEKKEAQKRVANIKKRKLFKPEMLDCSEQYLNYIKEYSIGIDGAVHTAVEQRVDFSEAVPDGFGTADCVVLGNDTIHLIDYKHGAGKAVSAYDNSQLKLYAYGAYLAYRDFYNFTDATVIKLSVVQPRNDIGTTSYDTTLAQLLEWIERTVKPAAILADKGEGEYSIGEHCQFCKASATCRARANNSTEATAELDTSKLPPLLQNDEIYSIVSKLSDLKTYLNKLEAHVKKELYAGNAVAGYKLVAGRSSRVFTEGALSEIAAKELQPEAMLYEKKPISVAALEKIVGKKDFSDNYGEYVRTETGSPSVADASSKKPAITMAQNDFKDLLK